MRTFGHSQWHLASDRVTVVRRVIACLLRRSWYGQTERVALRCPEGGLGEAIVSYMTDRQQSEPYCNHETDC